MEGHYYCLRFGDTSASVSREWQKLQKFYDTTTGIWENILTHYLPHNNHSCRYLTVTTPVT
jgi:hypothetical protein